MAAATPATCAEVRPRRLGHRAYLLISRSRYIRTLPLIGSSGASAVRRCALQRRRRAAVVVGLRAARLCHGATRDAMRRAWTGKSMHLSLVAAAGMEVVVWLLYEGREAHPIQRRRRASLRTTARDAIAQLQIPPYPPSSPGIIRARRRTFRFDHPMRKGRRHSAQRSACKWRQEGGMGRHRRARRARASQVGPDNGSAVWHGYTAHAPRGAFDGSPDALLHAGEYGCCSLVDGHAGSVVVGGDIRCEGGESSGMGE